jgi:hypothetical protein
MEKFYSSISLQVFSKNPSELQVVYEPVMCLLFMFLRYVIE